MKTWHNHAGCERDQQPQHGCVSKGTSADWEAARACASCGCRAVLLLTRLQHHALHQPTLSSCASCGTALSKSPGCQVVCGRSSIRMWATVGPVYARPEEHQRAPGPSQECGSRAHSRMHHGGNTCSGRHAGRAANVTASAAALRGHHASPAQPHYPSDPAAHGFRAS